MKNKETNAYIKTEMVLKNYNKIHKSSAILSKELEELKKQKNKISKSIMKTEKVVLKDCDNNYYYTDETLENRINEIEQLIIKVDAEIKFIDDCLSEIKDEEYYNIIPEFYFNNKTIEYLAELFDTSTKTIYYNKKKLIHKLSFLIVPLDKMNEIKKIVRK